MSNEGKNATPPRFGLLCPGTQDLEEYRRCKQQADASEALLDEFFSALEEFGLAVDGCRVAQTNRAAPGQSGGLIHCRTRSYTPTQLRVAASAEAIRFETLTENACAARGRVLTLLLHRSHGLPEFRALRGVYIDSADEPQRAADFLPPVQGGLC